MKELMIDLETLGTGVDTPILEIAATAREKDKVVSNFEVCTCNAYILNNICLSMLKKSFWDTSEKELTSLKEQMVPFTLLHGASVDTMLWWQHTYNGHPCMDVTNMENPTQGEAIASFVRWYREVDPEQKALVWCEGMFDIPIINYNLQQSKIGPLWKFYNERDLRSVKKFLLSAKDIPREPEDAHNALADCEYQFKVLDACREVFTL